MSSHPRTTIEIEEKIPLRDFILILAIGVFLSAVCFLTIAKASSWRSPAHSGWSNPIDVGIETHLNRFANRWPNFDLALGLFTEHNLIKGAPVVFLYWMAFFPMKCSENERLQKRRKLVAAVPLALFALALTRVFALALPFRDRPIEVASLNFQIPHGDLPALVMLQDWHTSSFPSDHVALFIALAVGVWLASRRLGAIAIAYTVVFIAFPRMYIGIHWPTDLFSAAIIGAGVASLASLPAYQKRVWQWVNTWWSRSEGSLAASAFLLSYEITDLFAGPIKIVSALLKHRH